MSFEMALAEVLIETLCVAWGIPDDVRWLALMTHRHSREEFEASCRLGIPVARYIAILVAAIQLTGRQRTLGIVGLPGMRLGPDGPEIN